MTGQAADVNLGWFAWRPFRTFASHF